MHECVTRTHFRYHGTQAAEYAWGAKLEEVTGDDGAPGDDGEMSDDGVEAPTSESTAEGGDTKTQPKTPKPRSADAEDDSDAEAEDEGEEVPDGVNKPVVQPSAKPGRKRKRFIKTPEDVGSQPKGASQQDTEVAPPPPPAKAAKTPTKQAVKPSAPPKASDKPIPRLPQVVSGFSQADGIQQHLVTKAAKNFGQLGKNPADGLKLVLPKQPSAPVAKAKEFDSVLALAFTAYNRVAENIEQQDAVPAPGAAAAKEGDAKSGEIPSCPPTAVPLQNDAHDMGTLGAQPSLDGTQESLTLV